MELRLKEISALAETEDRDEVVTRVERVSTLVKRLENSIEKSREAVLDDDVSFEKIAIGLTCKHLN